ncbi:hypothetical protein RvY_07620 [Ramazzottius varieornatus]|uniref:Uncharacterized protein n=1 Tax=Ramazzottius varieornatus TaxID=947166 RepID=A0A1D1V7V1_RAMVA|nr:hypothetical protein RvY_07620 [Ramazzottius varieornatus]
MSVASPMAKAGILKTGLSNDDEQGSQDSFYDLEEQLIKNIKEVDTTGATRTRTIISGYEINYGKLLGKGIS